MWKYKNTILSVTLFVLTGAVGCLAAFLYGKTSEDMIRITIMALIGIGIVLFLSAEGREKNSLLYNNEEFFGRFCGFYAVGLAGAVLFPVLPVQGWSYPVIFIVLGLLSSPVVGMSAGSTLLFLSVFLGMNTGYTEFFMYFFSGMAGIVVFSYIDERFQVGLPMLISLSIFTVSAAAGHILMVDGDASKDQLFEITFIILANVLVCVLMLLIFLRFFSNAVIYRHRDKYTELNDPECPLLVELKNRSVGDYYQAVHTAYLGDKIAKRLKLNEAVTKTCGYYYKIGILRGSNSWKSIMEVCREYRFPSEAVALLKEYTDQETPLISKEAVVVLFADTLVASILYLFSKNPKIQPDYDQIIEVIFQKKLDGGILDKSCITFGELMEMKKLLKGEKLYYDFLR